MDNSYELKYPTWVTVYTDASWCSPDKSGWSAWIRYTEEPKRVIASGICPPGTKDSSIAELIAIYEGIMKALDTWPSITGVGVKSDCQIALRWADRSQKSDRRDVRPLVKQLHKVLKKRNVRLRCSWVKGHQNDKSVPTYLNNQVDALARKSINI